jgi:AcrR family transcriptional regulator
MAIYFQVKINEGLFLKDPQDSVLGKRIVSEGILLMAELGMEQFTFRKLATRIKTTEASIYRYFENKHRFLLYLLSMHWLLLDYHIKGIRDNKQEPLEKIEEILLLLSVGLEAQEPYVLIDSKALHTIILVESNKAYLTKEVDEDNKNQFFFPYKQACIHLSEIFLQYNSKFKYARSLASTLIEVAHLQDFFAKHLPTLTNVEPQQDPDHLRNYLRLLVFSTLDAKS